MKLSRLFLLFSLLGTLLPRVGSAAEQEVVNSIVAQVGGSVITRQDVLDRTREYERSMITGFTGAESNLIARINTLREQTAEQLVVEKLILNEFKTLSYQLPARIVEEQIDDDIKRKYGGSRLKLTQTLQAEGTTFEAYRTRVEEITIIQLMQQRFVPANPPIPPARLESYYREHVEEYKLGDRIQLRTIVILTREGLSPQRLIEEIRRKIVNDGAVFDEMARIHSDGSQKTEGGDWGWIERGVLQPNLSAIAFSLKAGEISQPTVAPEGTYLMLVEGVSPAHTRPLAEVREQIEAALRSEKQRQDYKTWIDKLKAKSFIRFNPV